MGRELWAVGFKRCAARYYVVIGAFGAWRCARLFLSSPRATTRDFSRCVWEWGMGACSAFLDICGEARSRGLWAVGVKRCACASEQEP